MSAAVTRRCDGCGYAIAFRSPGEIMPGWECRAGPPVIMAAQTQQGITPMLIPRVVPADYWCFGFIPRVTTEKGGNGGGIALS